MAVVSGVIGLIILVLIAWGLISLGPIGWAVLIVGVVILLARF